jgi:hypothetical protein
MRMANKMNIFEGPIREYKTKQAAEKFAARVIGGAYVIKSYKSVFDMYHPNNKPIYQVFVKEE